MTQIFGIGILLGVMFLTFNAKELPPTVLQLKAEYYFHPEHWFAERDSSSEYGEFKQNALHTLIVNERALIGLHKEIHSAGEKIDAKYFYMLFEFRLQNNVLRNRVLDYHEHQQHNWAAFEDAFIKDANNLTHAIGRLPPSTEMWARSDQAGLK